MPADAHAGLSVRAPARLHLGFLDPSASLGRRFGSLGLVVDGFDTVVEVHPADSDELRTEHPSAAAQRGRVLDHLRRLRERTGCTMPLSLRLLQVPPTHAGFGSGTQLALAVGRAFAAHHGLDVPTATLAQWLGRGQRSGIGITGFDQGGLLVDGGPGADGAPAPLLARLVLPPQWQVLVVLDERQQGLSGVAEREALTTLPPLPRERAAEICHELMMRVLPGAALGEFAPFAAGVNRIQEVLGHHFAPAQAGGVWTSAAVGRLMLHLRGSEPMAIGQSSWGPTGFVIVPSAADAMRLIVNARHAGAVDPALDLRIVGARGHGAIVTPRTPMTPTMPLVPAAAR
jgi:beta-RFAP synthase